MAPLCVLSDAEGAELLLIWFTSMTAEMRGSYSGYRGTGSRDGSGRGRGRGRGQYVSYVLAICSSTG